MEEIISKNKIILSRKGFDSGFGGYPSPILSDGTLLSMPIPCRSDSIKFSDLDYNGRSYYEILKDFLPGNTIVNNGNRESLTPETACHLDPDIYRPVYKRDNSWKPLFGQIGNSQIHLKKQGVKEGALFLFFGWFRNIQNNRFVGPHIHVVFGYFEIEKVIETIEDPFEEWMKYHPHFQNKYMEVKSNTVYVARKNLSFNKKLPGAGVFKFDDSLVLTKESYSRSRWDLPSIFKSVEISHHPNPWRINPKTGEEYFQSATIGQEFVVKDDSKQKIINWAKNLIEENIIMSFG